MSEIFLLLLLGVLVLLWQSGARSKEQAVAIAKRECLRKQLQLLDQTVVLDHLRLHRGAEGWLVIWRHYRFDYCLLYTSPSPRDGLLSRMPSSA